MAAAVSITPDGRWFRAPGLRRQPVGGVVSTPIAAIWTCRPVEQLREVAAGQGAAAAIVRGPGGRVARFVGRHPSHLLRDEPGQWWQTDLDSRPPAPPEDPPQEAEVLQAPSHAAPDCQALEPALGPAPGRPAADALPPSAETANSTNEPLPPPAPLSTSSAEIANAAPTTHLPQAKPDPAPQAAMAPPSAAAVIQEGVAAIVEQLQAQGLLGATGELAILLTDAVVVAPRRFQFRLVSHHGALREVSRWNPDLAGTLSVWRDPANGQVFVVDGHHRATLAQRLGVPTLAVRFLQAANDREARTIGAAINIGHGNATAIDAAKLLRDGGLTPEQVAAYGLPPGGRVLRDGLLLARLAPPLFERVAIGSITLEMALALAAAGENHTLQVDLWRVARRNGWTPPAVAEAAEMARLATVRNTSGDGLLPGLELGEESNLEALLAVRAAIRSRLRGEIRALGAAARARDAAVLQAAGNRIDQEGSRAARAQTQAVAHTFAALINAAGPLADLVRMLAAEVSPTRSAMAVVDEHLGLVRDAIAGELGSLGL